MKTALLILLGCCVTTWMAVAAETPAKKSEATPTRASILEKYDANKDGKLDETERKAMQKDRQAELLKKYDKNGDGKLDDEEKAAAREEMKKRGIGAGGEKAKGEKAKGERGKGRKAKE